MNFKKQAKQLEHFLEEEFKQKTPLALLPNGNIAYGNFLIKQNKLKEWQLCRPGGFILDTFNVKSCAIIAARLYGSNSFSKYSELKILDQLYYKNYSDSEVFKKRYNTTKDYEKRDLYLARFIYSEQYATYAKEQIASRFKMLF
jgi:hypothetical protein